MSILTVDPEFQPGAMKTIYPPHNRSDYGIEQDFQGSLGLVRLSSGWDYLPIYWTRYHLLHDNGKTGQKALQDHVNNKIVRPEKTFTVCQYDDGPLVNLGDAILFLGSRKGQHGIDVPLMSYPHKDVSALPKCLRASFTGRLRTHPIRSEMQRVLGQRADVDIRDASLGEKPFVDQILQSYIALCPRGYGGSSFRFFEAMQLGTVPMLIGDIDTRPFKRFLDWNSMSLYAETPEEANSLLDHHLPTKLIEMGQRARDTWYNELSFGHWWKYVFRELEDL